MAARQLFYVAIPLCISVISWYAISREESKICRRDFSQDEAPVCSLKCPAKHFALPWMESCRPWFTCEEIESTDFHIVDALGHGAVKVAYLVEWKDHHVVLNVLLIDDFSRDFHHGLQMLIAFEGSPYVTRLLGYCKDSYVTEYHKLGSADNLTSLLQKEPLSAYRDPKNMMRMCQSYVEIFRYLHDSPMGTRVMCDACGLKKILTQYLLRDDLQLVVNDLDALPEVNHTAGLFIKCGNVQYHGELAAPEQYWPHEDEVFDDEAMPPYDEKTDIWKIPGVCEHFLKQATGSDAILFHLFKIHKQCQSIDPSQRPTAGQVLEVYSKVLQEI